MSSTKRATIVEVAKLAGVSTATAARVFDPKWVDRVREETRARVLDAARTLNYHGGGALVRGMQGRGTNIIALVIGQHEGYLYRDVLSQFIHILQQNNKQVLVFEVDPRVGFEPVLKQVYNYRVDAVIVTTAHSTQAVVQIFAQTDIPVIGFNMLCDSARIHSLHCDIAQAAQTAAAHLLEQGHKTFGIVTGELSLSRNSANIEHFCEYITQNGGKILEIVHADYGYKQGQIAARILLDNHRPDAIFCAEDTIAMGVLDVARFEKGLRVPEDIAIMGFDGAMAGTLDGYRLTTMEYPIQRMITDSVALLEEVLEHPETQRVLEYRLKLRHGNTTGARICEDA